LAEKAKIIDETVVTDEDENLIDGGSENDGDDLSEKPEQSLEEKLKEALENVKSEHDSLLRLSAEFENYKKRSVRETSEYKKFANEALIKQLLTVIDNLERAISSSTDNKKVNDSLIDGVEMTLKEILKMLEQFSVKPLKALEQPFDPNFHLAVTQEETDKFPDNTVIKELQKGYILHDRLIRPAMVMVSKKPADDETSETEETKESVSINE